MDSHPPFITILTAEDDPGHRELVRQAFLESGQKNAMFFVLDGLDLMHYLHREGRYAQPGEAPRPDLILLDLNMPLKDGRDALSEIKADPSLRGIPVVVFSLSDSEQDILYAYNLGVAGFIVKPFTFQGWVDVVKCLSQYWFEVVELAGVQHGTTQSHQFTSLPPRGSRVL